VGRPVRHRESCRPARCDASAATARVGEQHAPRRAVSAASTPTGPACKRGTVGGQQVLPAGGQQTLPTHGHLPTPHAHSGRHDSLTGAVHDRHLGGSGPISAMSDRRQSASSPSPARRIHSLGVDPSARARLSTRTARPQGWPCWPAVTGLLPERDGRGAPRQRVTSGYVSKVPSRGLQASRAGRGASFGSVTTPPRVGGPDDPRGGAMNPLYIAVSAPADRNRREPIVSAGRRKAVRRRSRLRIRRSPAA
jgi:hypothetical protein